MTGKGIKGGGIYNRAESVGMGQFRDNTEKHKSSAGVMSPSFKCRICKQNKKSPGRKRISASIRDGFKCADCAAAGK